MKRSSKAAFLSFCTPMILAGALVAGCGDSGGATPEGSTAAVSSGTPGSSAKKVAATDSAKPTSSQAQAAPSSSAPKPLAEADTSAKAGGPTPAPATPTAGASSIEVTKVLPSDCASGRIYANIGKIATPELQATLESMRTKMMAQITGKAGADTEKLKKLEQLGKDANLQGAAQEIGVCIIGGNDGMIAVSFDSSKMKGSLADNMAKMIEAATGTAPTKSEDGGVTYLTLDKGVLAFSGSLMMFGKSVESVKAAITAKAGGAGFGGADGNVIWVKMDKQSINATVTEAGSDYKIRLSVPPPTKELQEAVKKDPKEAVKQAEAQLEKLAAAAEKMIPGAGDLVKKIKVSMDGANFVAELLLPKSAIIDLINKVGSMDLSKMKGI
ncbi:MAG: hypothetical protein U0414_09860 [Polyangiaceae bacterium]